MFDNRSYCGDLRISDIGEEVLLAGWVDVKRDLGGIVFIELRDVSGIVQIVVDSSISTGDAEVAEKVRSEYCILVKGTVKKRSDDTINPLIQTGEIEVVADYIELLNESVLPPFPIDSRNSVGEDMRLRYRFLDLRRDEMRDTIIKRHILMQITRKYLSDNRFFEIETPMLNKSTPEGARDFVVPSRINPGLFYALPQSPQLFKQILMVSGFDRYFQIVKCFRDEDLRQDRQPEFTQIDLEMSFITQDMILKVIEELMVVIVKELLGKDISIPFQRITYDEAIQRFGKDAPDTRFALELFDCSDIFSGSEFNVFLSTLANGGIIKGIVVEDDGRLSRKMLDDYTEYVTIFGAKGMPWVRYKNSSLEGGIAKFIRDDERERLLASLDLKDNSVILFSSDSADVVNSTLGNLRIKIARDLGMIDEDLLNFIWITDFPLLEYDNEDKRYYAKHHPFTSPVAEHVELLDNITPDTVHSIRAQSYDIVLNGSEIGGGSIRINNPEVQKKMFSVLGISDEEAKINFSFLIEAMRYGAPPHGGIALGLDRILMVLLKKPSIRDVIPFPKTQKGQCLMSAAPSPVSSAQLRELSIKILEK
jgi:aspartyl-tRNA synthetase